MPFCRSFVYPLTPHHDPLSEQLLPECITDNWSRLCSRLPVGAEPFVSAGKVRWDRVMSPGVADFSYRRDYVAADDFANASSEVEDAIKCEWKRVNPGVGVRFTVKDSASSNRPDSGLQPKHPSITWPFAAAAEPSIRADHCTFAS